MIELQAYEIDGIDYLVLEKIVNDGETYLYLANSNDPEDIMFRKIDKNDTDYIIPLENEEEVLKVINLFNDKK